MINYPYHAHVTLECLVIILSGPFHPWIARLS